MNMLQIALLAHLGAVGASAVVLAVRVAARHDHAGPLAAGRSASRTGHRRPGTAAAAAAAAAHRDRHEASVRRVGDSCDNLLAVSIVGRYQAEVMHAREPWRTLDAVE